MRGSRVRRTTKQSPGGFRQIPGLVLAPPLTPSPPPPQPRRAPPFDLHPLRLSPRGLWRACGVVSPAQASHVLLGSGGQRVLLPMPTGDPRATLSALRKVQRGLEGSEHWGTQDTCQVEQGSTARGGRTQLGPLQPQTSGRREPPPQHAVEGSHS